MSDNIPENLRTPKYEFIEGHFYCDGIKVQPSQMTVEEVLKYVPKDFQEGFLKHVNGGKTKWPQSSPTPTLKA